MDKQQENISENKQHQNEDIEQDIKKITPLNINKPKDSKDGVQSAINLSKLESLKFVCSSIRDYIGSYISIADTKAGVLIGIYTGIISLIVTKGPRFFEIYYKKWSIIEFITFGSLIFFISGVIASLLVVWPKTSTSKKQGLVSWVHISNYNSVDKYLMDLLSTAEDQIHIQIAELNYDLSVICKKKYKLLSLAFRAGVVGSILLVIIIVCR